MLKIDRHKFIIGELNKYGSILISDLSTQLSVSEETIRRDLKELESSGILKRIHGGAFLPEKDDKGAPVEIRETIFSKEKEALSSFVLKNYIKESDTIILDCSTTCLKLAQLIFNTNMKVTIITNSHRISHLFTKQSTQVKLIVIGGEFRHRSNSFVGYQATDSLLYYFADKAFISSPAIDLKLGLLDNNFKESRVRKTMLDQAKQHILIADHTKFFDSAEFVIADLNNIETIVTDKKLSAEWLDVLNNKNIKLDYIIKESSND
ncbi:DeoR/GlpR transcriptional regulator [Proteiniclasticum sp. SCR006]|uniref:DeoR/GlpR transcriptional regulator n=1 Tax=Proteiniclasticum aestuarii TaxID=2817862 RepID=A0A939KJV0_9CLOT|nr:DeoR/GlpR transcriptional regulator [Proteiniclasticum aestuarii]